jgi:predicted SnoaL-like aldol condensation-catalyzing enzyme
MKKLFLTTGCIIICFLMSCKESTSTGNDNSSQAEKNKANTKMVYKAIETGDVSGLDSIIDKDFIDHSGENGDVKGLDSLKYNFTQMHNHLNDIKMESIANATDGDYNFDLNRFTATTNSSYMGLPANYKINMMGIDVVKIKNGKAIEHWSYADPKDVMKMMQSMKMDTTKMH